MTVLYKDYSITYDPKPVPDRDFDFDWVHNNYDGPGDSRCGNAASLVEAKKQIDEIEDAN